VLRKKLQSNRKIPKLSPPGFGEKDPLKYLVKRKGKVLNSTNDISPLQGGKEGLSGGRLSPPSPTRVKTDTNLGFPPPKLSKPMRSPKGNNQRKVHEPGNRHKLEFCFFLWV